MRRRVRRPARRRAVARDGRARADRGRQPRAPGSRRAPTRAPATAPGSSSRFRIAFFRGGARRGAAARRQLRRRDVLPAARRRARARSSSSCSPTPRSTRASGSWAGATCPSTTARPASTASASAPRIRQLFVAAAAGLAQDAFERKLYVIRRRAELAAGPDLVIPSFSSKTVVYKGMLTAPQLPALLPRPPRRAVLQRARARPLAVLDQHVPELGARPSVPA